MCLLKYTQIAYDVASGLMFLHNRDVIHRDIAARNVFVDEALRGRIGDLGLARQLNENKVYKAVVDRPRPVAVSYLCLLFILSVQVH